MPHVDGLEATEIIMSTDPRPILIVSSESKEGAKATLRALEIKAQVIAKATRVDGVYDKDPLKFPDAVKYREITYLEVLSQALGVMDATSIAMCRDNKLPIIVFNLNTTGNIMRMSMGEPIGTVIH